MSLGVYIHVPFCAKKCPYCDFYSGAYSSQAAEEYVEAVCARIRDWMVPGEQVDSVYFGGGTPGLLSPAQIGRILDTLSSRAEVRGEITMETNPNVVRKERVQEYRAAGINRLSIGVQSFDDGELSSLGRAHTSARAVRAVNDAYDAGITNLSIDLMLGTPGQTIDSLSASLQTAVSLPISHLSSYLLKIEPGTPYAADETLCARCPDEDTTVQMYLKTVETLEAYGFSQYEISNFARPGFLSVHNLKYWRCEPYIGIGPAAHSCVNGRRFASKPDRALFCAHALAGTNGDVVMEEGTACDAEEVLMLAMRLTEGVDVLDYCKRFSMTEASFLRAFKPYEQAGYVMRNGSRLRFTPEGFLVSNAILSSVFANLSM